MREWGGGEAGQAAVEAALVLPLMLFLLLGLLQLTLMQQARLLTEYAAFSAARAGIVWNGSSERMHDAARVALLPTFGRVDSMERFGATWARAAAQDDALQALDWGPGPAAVNGVGLRGAVRVDTVSPAGWAELGDIWNLRGGPEWEELEFDAPDTLSERAGMAAHVAPFLDRSLADPSQSLYRRATVLRVRVRYLYELRIPFAGFLLFTSWFASNAGVLLQGPVDRPTLEGGGDLAGLEAQGKGVAHGQGFDTVTPSEMRTLWRLSNGALGPRRCFIPLTATHSMRMQSSFHRKWLVHESPGWSP